MTKTIKQAITFLTEWNMLKIYATIMTTIFLCIWIPTMFMVIKELIKTFI